MIRHDYYCSLRFKQEVAHGRVGGGWVGGALHTDISVSRHLHLPSEAALSVSCCRRLQILATAHLDITWTAFL